MNRRRQASSVLHTRAREVAAGLGVSLLGQALLGVLLERTGRGTHAADCGRPHLGRELAKVAGRDRPYSVRTVARYLAELTLAGLIHTRRRWDPGFREHLPAFRYLSPKLLEAVGELARQRAKGRRRGHSTEDTARPRYDDRTGTAPAAGEACSSCHVIGDHLSGCPNAPPTG